MNIYNQQSHKIFSLSFLIAVFTSITGLGQTTVSVAPVNMNVLYIGIDNPVSIAVSSAADEKVTVTIEGAEGTISKLHAGLYNVRVNNQTDNCSINVFVDGKLTGTSKFRVRRLPQPFATIGGFKSGAQLTSDNLLRQSGVGVGIENFPVEVNYKVAGFTVKLADDKGNIKSAECEGGVFSAEAKQFINEYAKPGQIVTIENILVKAPDGNELHLPSLLYSIK